MKYLTVAVMALIVASLVVHKRTRFRAAQNRSPRRAFWISFLMYWVPAFLAWAWLVHTVASIARLPEPTPGLAILVGGYLLSDWMLRNELFALRRKL